MILNVLQTINTFILGFKQNIVFARSTGPSFFHPSKSGIMISYKTVTLFYMKV